MSSNATLRLGDWRQKMKIILNGGFRKRIFEEDVEGVGVSSIYIDAGEEIKGGIEPE